jgi:hypothetical protein
MSQKFMVLRRFTAGYVDAVLGETFDQRTAESIATALRGETGRYRYDMSHTYIAMNEIEAKKLIARSAP